MRPALASVLLICATGLAQTPVDPARVDGLVKRAVVLDLHCDTTQLMVDEGYDLGQAHDYGEVDVPRMRKGGVTGVFFSIFTPPQRVTPLESVKAALIQIDTVRGQVRRLSTDLVMAASADEVLAAKKQGKIAALLGLEGGHMIDSSLPLLRTYFALGVRYLTLTHSTNTPWADSSGAKPAHNGLTPFGRDVVREMNRLGMMVDISHPSKNANLQAIELSKAPVIASHSAARALADVSRNLDDVQLNALKRNGGVVQTVGFASYVKVTKPDSPERATAIDALRKEFGIDAGSRSEERRVGKECRL